MSRLPRRDLIEEPEVGIYHCVQRAVRRAFLCGQDAVTGQNFDHRKAWIQQRLEFLTGQFGIEVLSFADMSTCVCWTGRGVNHGRTSGGRFPVSWHRFWRGCSCRPRRGSTRC